MALRLDFDFAPADYRDVPSPAAALLLNVKGDLRRRLLRDVVSGRAGPGLDPALWAEGSSDLVRGILGRAHPQWLGGEYLPDYLPGEVEIARVTLANVTRDVVSVRARFRHGRYHYRMVDEYGIRWLCRPKTSAKPLVMWRLIQLIDTARLPGTQWPDLTDELRDAHGGAPADAAAFVEVTSDLYPGLEAHYRNRAEQWLARNRGSVTPLDSVRGWTDSDRDESDEEPWAG
jgi:hypothetical protein